jgi:cytosine/adenosine deaminase-related metal-dependent hydrolase
MLEEMRFLAQHRPDLDKDTILCLGTLAGAKALGRDADLGSLTPGKLADWITVPLSDATRANPLEELLLGNEPVQDVYISGRRVETLD